MAFDVEVTGADDAARALRGLIERTGSATEAALKEGASTVQDQIQANLIRRFYPPASPPGQPPASRTGLLFDRVLRRIDGEVAAGIYQARVYPSTVYARIQELGGIAGRGHRSHLPPRPYVRPAVEAVRDRVLEAFIAEWSRARGG
jgi:HK97 gp10 family phage protein